MHVCYAFCFVSVTVECTTSTMTVTYWPRSDFHGRLYVSGYSETCSTTGQGKNNPTRLVVPFQGTACGINQAYALANDREKGENRWSTQYTFGINKHRCFFWEQCINLNPITLGRPSPFLNLSMYFYSLSARNLNGPQSSINGGGRNKHSNCADTFPLGENSVRIIKSGSFSECDYV